MLILARFLKNLKNVILYIPLDTQTFNYNHI